MRNLFDNPLLLIVLLLIIVLVFGAKRLPDAARSVGRSMRILKSEVREMQDDDGSGTEASKQPVEGRVFEGAPSDERAQGGTQSTHPAHDLYHGG